MFTISLSSWWHRRKICLEHHLLSGGFIQIKILIRTRPWPAFGRQGLVGSSGGYTYHGYTSHASPRACGARLGLQLWLRETTKPLQHSNLPTFLPSSLPTFQPFNLPAFQHSSLPNDKILWIQKVSRNSKTTKSLEYGKCLETGETTKSIEYGRGGSLITERI